MQSRQSRQSTNDSFVNSHWLNLIQSVILSQGAWDLNFQQKIKKNECPICPAGTSLRTEQRYKSQHPLISGSRY